MKKNKYKFLSFKLILIFPMILLGVFYGPLVFGQTEEVNCAPSQHKLEIQLPGFNKCVNGPADYLSSLYKLSLGIGVFLAAVVIVMAGIKYATSGDNAGKQKEAREDITQAIFGLLILFGSVIILRTINPDLSDLSKWQNLPIISLPPSIITPPMSSKDFDSQKQYDDSSLACREKISDPKAFNDCMRKAYECLRGDCDIY